MHHIEGCTYDQSQLLPSLVDDYMHPENPVRFINAFIGGLDLPGVGFTRVEPKQIGRRSYDPADLLALFICGYLNIQSVVPMNLGS